MTSKKNELITPENKKEIFYNIINSMLAGGLVFFGSLTGGEVTLFSCFSAFAASAIVFLTKFKNYWDSEKPEYSKKIFTFL